jgi:hypothetical protein
MNKTVLSLIIMVLFGAHVAILQAQKSIIPDINAEGKRGEIARKMHERSSLLFLRADTNQDYKISLPEAEENLTFISKKFSHYDSNNDNSLSWQKYLGHNQWPAPKH